MIQSPPLSSALKYPITFVIGVLAIAASLLWWAEKVPEIVFGNYFSFWSSPWTPLTNTLFHVDVLHLAFNIYWLWYFGTHLEQICKKQTVLLSYVLLAVFSEVASYTLGEFGVGLSGVVYGLFTLFWVAGQRDERFAGRANSQVAVLFVVWFFVCIALTARDIMQVGNVAHAAGAAFGLLLGVVLTPKHAGSWPLRWLTPLLITLLCLSLADPLRQTLPNLRETNTDEVVYRAYMLEEQGDLESALAMLLTAVEREPGNDEIWHALAATYHRQELWPDAAKAYSSAAKLEPGSAELWFRAGESLGQAGLVAEADEAFLKWESLHDNDPTRMQAVTEWYQYWKLQAAVTEDTEREAYWQVRLKKLDAN